MYPKSSRNATRVYLTLPEVDNLHHLKAVMLLLIIMASWIILSPTRLGLQEVIKAH